MGTRRQTALPLPFDNSTPAGLAEALLCEWEARTRPAPTSAYRAARPPVLAQLAGLGQLLMQPADTSVTADDVRTVLRHATAFRLGRAAATGLDRIQNLTCTRRTFTPPAGFDGATYFAHCFGITRPTDGTRPQEIRLRLAPVQGRYALGYPLHSSQQLVTETADEIQISLTVYDTHELRMELLSYGPDVEVLAPPSLREWLRATHHAAAST